MTIPVTPSTGTIVVAGPYEPAAIGAGNWGTSGPLTREFMTLGNSSNAFRIRQKGNVSRVKFACNDKAKIDEFYVCIWRETDYASGLWDRVATTPNLIDDMEDGMNTLNLATPIAVLPGDAIGYRITWNTVATNFYAVSHSSYISYYKNGVQSDTLVNWEGETAIADRIFPVEVHMEAPQFVAIGDSMMGRADSMIGASVATFNQGDSVPGYLAALLDNSTYQNMGIGSQTTTQIAARFAADVVALAPNYVLINGGLNDIGTNDLATFLANWNTIFAAASASGIHCYVMSLPPDTAATAATMRTADSWNKALRNLMATSYPWYNFIDVGPHYGKFRTAGDAGNFWDIKTAYADVDNIHPNQAGRQKLANVIYNLRQRVMAESLNRFSTKAYTNSLYANTAGQKVTVTTNDVFNFDKNTDFTIMAWANGPQGNGQVIRRRTTKGYVLQMGSLNGKTSWDFFLNNGANVNYASTVSVTGWTLGCGVFRSGFKELWVNGVLNRSTDASAMASFAAAGEALSVATVSTYPFYTGPIRIYARALSATEIQNFYWYGIEPATTNLLLSYNLTEGAGTSLTDLSGNGYNGTFSGAVAWNTTNIPRKSRSATTSRAAGSGKAQV